MSETPRPEILPRRRRWQPHVRHQCGDCGVREGRLHRFGCLMEDCPFCGGQLSTCRCSYQLLGYVDPHTYDAETEHLPPLIYHGGLPDEAVERWILMLEARGRIPCMKYPNLCARCGAVSPEMWYVPTAIWQHYVPPAERDTLLCTACWQFIVAAINRTRPFHLPYDGRVLARPPFPRQPYPQEGTTTREWEALQEYVATCAVYAQRELALFCPTLDPQTEEGT